MVYGGSDTGITLYRVAGGPPLFLWQFYGRAAPMTIEMFRDKMSLPYERRFLMKECIKCQNPLPLTAEYCPNCGQEQPKPKEKVSKKRKSYDNLAKADLGTYYEDIIPEDAEELKNRRADNPMVLRLILLGFGVAIVLAACVAVLILLGGEL